MKLINLTIGTFVALALVAGGVLALPFLLADRLTHPVLIGHTRLFGVPLAEVSSQLKATAEELSAEKISVEFRGKTYATTLADLGVSLNVPATTQKIFARRSLLPWQTESLEPELQINQFQLLKTVNKLFASQLKLPQNASLAAARGGTLRLIPSRGGERPDSAALIVNLRQHLAQPSAKPLALRIIPAAAEVQDNEVTRAQELTEKILSARFTVGFEDKTFPISQSELVPLLDFVEQVDPQDPTNLILGVRLEPEKLRSYLAKHIAPQIDQPPIDAKFELIPSDEGEARVNAFASPQRGLTLNIDASAESIARALISGASQADLSVAAVEPAVAENADLKELGITTLLAHGETNFAGSPRNRIHNITVGARRYHGLLIAPEEEFSFNDRLGPVTAEAGFKPELVIKEHTTVPELGGGLCQVSTTAFRAAIYSGLEVTQRRNHAYAVRYYGIPGFDATIYPGYTDLRFRNNTPGHILVQTKIEGNKLSFDFWGTSDGRIVEVAGPNPYNRQSSGAVKATLTQRVLKDGETVFEKTFNSNYKSPNLFPHITAANGEQPTTTTPAATPNPTPIPIEESAASASPKPQT